MGLCKSHVPPSFQKIILCISQLGWPVQISLQCTWIYFYQYVAIASFAWSGIESERAIER